MSAGRLAPLALLLAALSGCERPRSEVLVGLAAHPSGVNGAALALEDLQAQGLELQLRTASREHSGAVGPEAVALAESFVHAGAVAVIGHSSSAASLSAAPILNRARVPLLLPNSTSPLLSGVSPWVFRLCGNDNVQGQVLASYARRSGLGRAAILYVLDDYGKGLAAAFARSLEQQGGRVLLAAGYSSLTDRIDADLGGVLRRLKASGADVLLLAARTRDLMLLKGGELLREPGWPPLLGGDVAYVPLDAAGAGAPFEGMVVTTFVPPRSSEAQRFAERYRGRFGLEPDNSAYACYDALGLVGQAVRQEGPRPADIQRYLRRLGRDLPPYRGLGGPLRFDERGDARDAGFSLARVTAGALVPVALP